MAIYWDQCEVTFANKTDSPLKFSTWPTTAGFPFNTATNLVAPLTGTGTFTGSSDNANASSGCAGVVSYSLDNGTMIIIDYRTSYYYGVSDNSRYSVGFSGPLSSRYDIANSNVITDSSNGGAGKRVKWTFDVIKTS